MKLDWVDKIAQQWRREKPGLDLLPMEIVGRLTGAVTLIRRDRLEPFFARHGLQVGEFDVLASLRRAGVPYRLTPTDLYESLMMSSGGMTNRIDRLEKQGFVERKPNPNDRRGTLVGLTQSGLELVDSLIGRHIDNEKNILSRLDEAEQVEFNRLLTKLLQGLKR